MTSLGPLTVTDIRPYRGPVAGGTRVRIAGTGFVDGAAVTIGGAPATGVSWRGSKRIDATTPAGVPGFVHIVVTNPDGQSGTGTGTLSFEYFDLEVTAVDPTSGLTTGGMQVLITGFGFVDGAEVWFQGYPPLDPARATGVRVTSPKSIRATTPAYPAGGVAVEVRNPDGQQAGWVREFEYREPGCLALMGASGGVVLIIVAVFEIRSWLSSLICLVTGHGGCI